jgi:hypothetical protein
VQRASIERRIYIVRGQKVLIDNDLALLYRVPTKIFNQAVRRNMARFPADFMFQLSSDETENLRSQIVTSSWGGRRYLPLVFTEQGVAMLSSVLKSERAIQVNIAIMRAFVKLRELLATHKELDLRLRAGEEVSEARRTNPGSVPCHSSASRGHAGQARLRLSRSGIAAKMREVRALRH